MRSRPYRRALELPGVPEYEATLVCQPVETDSLLLQQAPRWIWYCWSKDPTLRTIFLMFSLGHKSLQIPFSTVNSGKRLTISKHSFCVNRTETVTETYSQVILRKEQTGGRVKKHPLPDPLMHWKASSQQKLGFDSVMPSLYLLSPEVNLAMPVIWALRRLQQKDCKLMTT